MTLSLSISSSATTQPAPQTEQSESPATGKAFRGTGRVDDYRASERG